MADPIAEVERFLGGNLSPEGRRLAEIHLSNGLSPEQAAAAIRAEAQGEVATVPTPADSARAQTAASAETAATFESQFPGLTFVSVDPTTGAVTARDETGTTAVFTPSGSTFVRAQEPSTKSADVLNIGGTYYQWNPQTSRYDIEVGSAGSPSAGPAAPTPRYSTQVIDGQVYRINDLTGVPEPTGVMVPAGVVSTTVDKDGNLVGIKSDGTSSVVAAGFDFPATDPERIFKLDEAAVTGFYNGQQTEAGRQADQAEAGANRRADLNARTTGFQSVNSTAPQLGQLALDNSKFVADTFSRPADFVARSFMSRGKESPFTTFTQADVISMLRDNIAGFQGALDTFNASTPGAVAPAAPPPPASTGFSATPAGNAGATVPAPAPTAASVTGFASQTEQINQALQSGQIDAGTALAQANAARTASFAPPAPAVAPAPQTGFTYTAPTLPTVPAISQSDIIGARDAARGPAISAIRDGGAIPSLRFPGVFKGGLPTARKWGQLTADERSALRTDLAVDNVSLDDVEQSIRNRFSPASTGPRAVSTGFAA